MGGHGKPSKATGGCERLVDGTLGRAVCGRVEALMSSPFTKSWLAGFCTKGCGPPERSAQRSGSATPGRGTNEERSLRR